MKTDARRWAAALLLALLVVPVEGCFYSFTGASVQPDVKTVSVMQFQNTAPLVQPALANLLTERVRDKFLQQSRLRLRPTDGDLQLSGEITAYAISPAAISAQIPGQGLAGSERAALNRLTITVNVKFENTKYPDQNWEKSFSNFSDFSATTNLAQVELGLIDEINEKLSQDIFNKALGSW
jgi:hypothetical protein